MWIEGMHNAADLLFGSPLLCPDVGIILCQCLGHGKLVNMQLLCLLCLRTSPWLAMLTCEPLRT